jgi:NAD(P)-dependent dehydrogenase (short-subunit alcohol dehydrogenase family)
MSNLHTKSLNALHAMVTGGSMGIGSVISERLSSSGASVTIVDVDDAKGINIVKKIESMGGKANFIHADLINKNDCEMAVKNALKVMGNINIIVNCAAPKRDKLFIKEIEGQDWENHGSIVLQSVTTLVNSILKNCEKKTLNSVINISSPTARAVGVDHCSWAYHVSKAGLEQLTRWLAVRLGKEGVRVNAIVPGLIDRNEGLKHSDDLKNRKIISQIIPLQRAGISDDVADLVIFLCSSSAGYITGQIINVDGGLGLSEPWSAALRGSQINGSN